MTSSAPRTLDIERGVHALLVIGSILLLAGASFLVLLCHQYPSTGIVNGYEPVSSFDRVARYNLPEMRAPENELPPPRANLRAKTASLLLYVLLSDRYCLFFCHGRFCQRPR